MRRNDVKRVALACLLGCAAGTPGRDIPVYREYTQPVLFYDEQGAVTVFNAAGPDLVALQSVRDVKAREGLIGKETLLDLTFESGASVFGDQTLQTGKMAPLVSGGGNHRGQKDDSGRNWLAKSLSLPGLGQTPTNAAESAISAGGKESSWGWLADEVVGQPGEESPQPEELQADEEFNNPVAEQEAAITDGNHPFRTDTPAAKAEKEKEKTESEPSTAATFPADAADGQKPSDLATEQNEASARDLEGGDRLASPTMKDYRATPRVAEMSQTHQMITEMSAGTRPDLSSSFRAVEIGASADSGRRAERELSGSSSPDFKSRPYSSTDWGATGSRQDFGLIPIGGASPAVSSWQGGWSAQNAGGVGSVLSRYENPSVPAPVPVVPVPPSGGSRTAPSSGGYKPAWF